MTRAEIITAIAAGSSVIDGITGDTYTTANPPPANYDSLTHGYTPSPEAISQITGLQAAIDSLQAQITGINPTPPGAVNGTAALAVTYDVTTTFASTGLVLALPSAGTYRIAVDVRTFWFSGSQTWFKLYNATAAADVANSIRFVNAMPNNAQLMTTITTLVTVAAAANIQLWMKDNIGSGNAQAIAYDAANTGGTVGTYNKIAA